MGLFNRSKPVQWSEWKAKDRWRAVEQPSGAVVLEREWSRYRHAYGVDPVFQYEWRSIGAWSSVDGCWAERHRIRLEEGLVIHYPPKDEATPEAG